jgi:hypothetical protein
MKKQMKQFLFQFGLFNEVDLVRRLPEITRWVASACSGIPPALIKRLIITFCLKRLCFRDFFGTETHIGDTLAFIAYNRVLNCMSIEVSDHYYKVGKQ